MLALSLDELEAYAREAAAETRRLVAAEVAAGYQRAAVMHQRSWEYRLGVELDAQRQRHLAELAAVRAEAATAAAAAAATIEEWRALAARLQDDIDARVRATAAAGASAAVKR